MASVLIVEDEVQIAQIVSQFIENAGMHCTVLYDGSNVINIVKQAKFDLIILDIMLPGVDGITICKRLRTFCDTPIIILTARTDETERIRGLEIGADDYVCKPFSAPELVLRIKAILKRLPSSSLALDQVDNGLNVDPEKMVISFNQNSANLTAIEQALFMLLYRQPERVFSRDEIMNNIYKDIRVVSDRTVDSHISKLRKKLNALSPNHEFISSVYGAGYKFSLNPKN